MEASEADGDNGASVVEPAVGVYEPALLEDPAGGAAAPPSAKDRFEELVREQRARISVNCWTQAQVDRCITCLEGWAELQPWERMERARAGYGELTSKPYGWVKEAAFVVAVTADADGGKTRTLLASHTDTDGVHHLVRVLAIEDFYEALQTLHEDSGHSKGRPLEDKVKKGLPRCRGGPVILQ